jgi:hypothetical protein
VKSLAILSAANLQEIEAFAFYANREFCKFMETIIALRTKE